MLRTLNTVLVGRNVADYLSLAKPRTVALHLLTALAAMILAGNGRVQPDIMWLTLMGGGLVAASANVLNCYFDRELDALMPRTRNRPLPSGRLQPSNALMLATATGLFGFFLLAIVGWLPVLLAFGGLSSYVLVYTLWLKRRSRWSALLSSAVGAFPPLTGWAAVTGHLDAVPLLLTAVIALWTPPHFWSLAVSRYQEYLAAGVPVIPGTKTYPFLAFLTAALCANTFLLIYVGKMGPVYSLGITILNTVIACLAFLFWKKRSRAVSGLFYRFSIFYLVSLFCLIVLDKVV